MKQKTPSSSSETVTPRRGLGTPLLLVVFASLVSTGTAAAGKTGSLGGVVTTANRAPRPPLKVTMAHEICGQQVPDETLLISDGRVANVVLSLVGLPRGPAPKPTTIEVDQKGCRFIPHLQAAPVGSTLRALSSDDLLHNIHAWITRKGRDSARTLFNLAMPSGGKAITRRLDDAGRIKLDCDAGHTWMSAYIHVFDHPYFAVTDRKGRFTIRDVPAGTWRLSLWHERLGRSQVTVHIRPDSTTALKLGI